MSYELLLPVDTGKVSDGYHTFDELYDHRHCLFINVLHSHKDIAFKTHKNHMQQQMPGWFIAGLNTRFGQITYHMPDEYFNCLNIKEVPYNHDYDGHSSQQVLERLRLFAF